MPSPRPVAIPASVGPAGGSNSAGPPEAKDLWSQDARIKIIFGLAIAKNLCDAVETCPERLDRHITDHTRPKSRGSG